MGKSVPSLFICLRKPRENGWPPSDESVFNFLQGGHATDTHRRVAIYDMLYRELRAIIEEHHSRAPSGKLIQIQDVAEVWGTKLDYVNQPHRDDFFADVTNLAQRYLNKLMSKLHILLTCTILTLLGCMCFQEPQSYDVEPDELVA